MRCLAGRRSLKLLFGVFARDVTNVVGGRKSLSASGIASSAGSSSLFGVVLFMLTALIAPGDGRGVVGDITGVGGKT